MVLPLTVKPAESSPTYSEGRIESFVRSVDSLEREATDEPLAIRTAIGHETLARITVVDERQAASKIESFEVICTECQQQ